MGVKCVATDLGASQQLLGGPKGSLGRGGPKGSQKVHQVLKVLRVPQVPHLSFPQLISTQRPFQVVSTRLGLLAIVYKQVSHSRSTEACTFEIIQSFSSIIVSIEFYNVFILGL